MRMLKHFWNISVPTLLILFSETILKYPNVYFQNSMNLKRYK